MSSAVEPETSPEIVSLSDPPVTKFTFSATIPPPAKSPVRVSVSRASESLPTSSVPVTARLPAVRLWAPDPKATVDPAPIPTVSHPLRASPASVPVKLWNSSVSLPSPPPMLLESMDAPPKTSIRSVPEPSATEPLILAPARTVTVESPAPSMIALALSPRAYAPLLSVTLTALPDGASVLMALLLETVLTVPETTMDVAPAPSLSTRIP